MLYKIIFCTYNYKNDYFNYKFLIKLIGVYFAVMRDECL